MGWKHRLAFGLATALLTAHALGCEDEEPAVVVQQRRELLTPPDYAKLRAERAEKRKLFDDEGMPIPTDQVIAGIAIPRGLTLTGTFEKQWTLQSAGVSAEKLAQYVQKRVLTTALERTSIGGYRFAGCANRENKSLPMIDVRISPLRDDPSSAELNILELKPPTPAVQRPSEQTVQAQIEAQRRNAD